MDQIFSNPMFMNSEDSSNDHPQLPSPRTSANKELIKTRDSVSKLMDNLGLKKKKKDKDQPQPKPTLDTLIEETTHQFDEVPGNINTSVIESESEVAKLKYENSLLSFSNKEQQQKLEDAEKEIYTLREFIKDHEKKFEEINSKVSEQDHRNQEINEDLQRYGEDNRRLLELETALREELRSKDGQIEELLRGMKEKENLIRDYESALQEGNRKFEEERRRYHEMQEEQIAAFREKIRSLENAVEGYSRKETLLNDMQKVLEQEKASFEANLRNFEESISLRDSKIQELQGVLAQKEDILLKLEGNKALISTEKEGISQEIRSLTERLEAERQEFQRKEEAIMQENRELLDLLDEKKTELTNKEETFNQEKKILEETIRVKDQELYSEKEGLYEEKLKLSNERLELEQKLRKVQGELDENLQKASRLSEETQRLSETIAEYETEKTRLLEEKHELESKLLEEKAKDLTTFSSDLEAKSQTFHVRLEEFEIENLVLKEKVQQFETQVTNLKNSLEAANREKEAVVRQLIEEKQSFHREKEHLAEQKKLVESSLKKFEGSMTEKENMIQELMGNLIEKESYIRNSTIEKDSELSKLKESYETEIGFYKKNEQEKNQIYENLMNKLLQGEKLLQTKQNTLTYFQENYQKILKEKESIEAQLKQKSEQLFQSNQKCESSQDTLASLEKRLKEYSKSVENLTKEIDNRTQEKETLLKKTEETWELRLRTEKSQLEAKLREKDMEILNIRQDFNKQKLLLEERIAEGASRTLRLEQEYQNKLLEISKGSETAQKDSMKKLEDLLDKRTKDLATKERKIGELEDILKGREKELKEISGNNRELQEKVAGFLREKESFLKENANFRESKLKVFEARMQEMQVRFNNEIETLSLSKLRLREEYETKLDSRLKELNEVKSIRKNLEEKVHVLTKEKELVTRESTLLKERLGKSGGLNSEETGNWITNVTKELKIENRLLQDDKRRLIEEYESRLRSREEEINGLKDQLTELQETHKEKVKMHGSTPAPAKKVAQFHKKPLFKENEIFNDVNRLKEKVKNLLIRYQRLLEALKDKPNVEINLRKYLTNPVNEILKLYMKILMMYYETTPGDYFAQNGLSKRKTDLFSIELCQTLQDAYLESGGNLEKEVNENMKNCLDFIMEFHSFSDPEALKRKITKNRGGFVEKRPRNSLIEAAPEGAVSLDFGGSMSEEKGGKNDREIAIKVFRVLERINSNLQSLKNAKIKEKVLIFCIIVKSFLNNESGQIAGNKGTVIKELEELRKETESNRYFTVLFYRIERLINQFAGEEELKEGVAVEIENLDSDLES